MTNTHIKKEHGETETMITKQQGREENPTKEENDSSEEESNDEEEEHEDGDSGSHPEATSKKSPHGQDSSAQASPSTSSAPNTPGRLPVGSPPGPATPGAHQVPIQPYGYPPYPYYPHMPPGYPPPGIHPPPVDQLMTGATNPYNYTDVSNIADPMPDTRRNRGGVTEPFPEKLHRMLEATEREGRTDVVSFFSHGRAFAIHKPRLFVQEIMPRFFRQSRLTSFQRQLNLYGFRRISQGPDNGGYYHELFLKGRPGLCVNMKRTKVKGAAKLKRDPDSEPNFYSYPPIKPLQQQQVNSPGGVPGGSSHSLSSPARQVASPPVPVYPGYPPYHPYPHMANPSPYTAAQQGPAAPPPVYPYAPPYYGYPYAMYPPPPSHMPPHSNTSTPRSSPVKGASGSKTPEGTPNGKSSKDSADESPGPVTVNV